MAAHFKTVLDGASDHDKLHDLCKLTYKEQGVWFLNAFWEGGIVGGKRIADDPESIWNYVHKASVIDNVKASGNALDELEAHRFLEAFHEAHTVLEMRSQLRKTGALAENERPKEVPLTHFLLFKYAVNWHKLVNAPQGDNSAQIAEAQDKLEEVQRAFDASTKADAEASAALREALAREKEAKESEDAAVAREAEAVSTENEARARESDARVAEAPFKAAQEEVEAALAEVRAQENAYNEKTAQLKKDSEEGGVVSRNRAKVQLDAHLAEDPLPLRKAKITLEAANKKAERARAPFQAATEIATAARAKAEDARLEAEAARKEAEADRQKAEAARSEAEEAKGRAEEAVAAAQAAVAEAEALLEEIKASSGSGQGALWWIDRELTEKKKYMPVSKGGIRK